VPQGGHKEGKVRWSEKKKKLRKRGRGLLLDKTKGLPLMFLKTFFFSLSQLCMTFELQGFGHVWVQLPKEFYMKNKYKNIKIAK
jgi:hypothetical protein